MTVEDGFVRVVITTPYGRIVCAIDTIHAPVTAANFLAYADGGYLDGTEIYRIATLANQAQPEHQIDVIQWGYRLDPGAGPLPRIIHEPTGVTGLRHKRGTLSMARREVGTAGPGFFFCMGGELSALDQGGERHPDGQGFAAFGEVTEGMDTLEAIMATADPQQEWLPVASKILSVARL